MKKIIFITLLCLINIGYNINCYSQPSETLKGYWNISPTTNDNVTERFKVDDSFLVYDITKNTSSGYMKLSTGAMVEIMGLFGFGMNFSSHQCKYYIYNNDKIRITSNEEFYYLNITLDRMTDSEATDFENDLELIYKSSAKSYSMNPSYTPPSNNSNNNYEQTYSCSLVNQQIKMYQDNVNNTQKRINLYQSFNKPDMYTNLINSLNSSLINYQNSLNEWKMKLSGCKN
jgi:hypothetical protein